MAFLYFFVFFDDYFKVLQHRLQRSPLLAFNQFLQCNFKTQNPGFRYPIHHQSQSDWVSKRTRSAQIPIYYYVALYLILEKAATKIKVQKVESTDQYIVKMWPSKTFELWSFLMVLGRRLNLQLLTFFYPHCKKNLR